MRVEQAVDQLDPTDVSIMFFDIFVDSVPYLDSFDMGDVMVSSTEVHGDPHVDLFTKIDAMHWRVRVVGAPNDSTVTVSVPADSFFDDFENGNPVSTSIDNQVTYHVDRPTVDYQETTDNTPVITGTCTPGHQMSMKVSVQDFHFTCPVSGRFEQIIADQMPDGVYDIIFRDDGLSGDIALDNTNPDLVIDATAPTVVVNQLSSQSDPTNVSLARFSATFSEPVAPGCSASSKWSFGASNPTSVGGSGLGSGRVTVVQESPTVFLVTVSELISSSTVSISLNSGRCEDMAGNPNVASTSTDNQVTFDNDTPLPPVITMNGGKPSSGTVHIYVSDKTPIIEGTGEPRAMLHLVKLDDGSTVCDIAIDEAGLWRCTPPEELSLGDHSFVAVQKDPAQNTSARSNVSLIKTTPSGDTDGDGVTDFEEDLAPNGDGNGDGIADKLQAGVATTLNPVTGTYSSIELKPLTSCDTVVDYTVVSENSNSVQDSNYEYPLGLNGFVIRCSQPGQTANVTFIYPKKYDTTGWLYRKYNEATNTYVNMDTFVSYGDRVVGGKHFTTAVIRLTDGSINDFDGKVDGVIYDPSGPVMPVATTPIPTPPKTGQAIGGIGAIMLAAVAFTLHNRKNKRLIKNN